MFGRRLVAVVVVVGIVALGGCSSAEGPSQRATQTPTSSASSTPDAAASSPAASPASAAEQALAPFVTAAGDLDALIADTAVQVNGLFVPDGVRYMDSIGWATAATERQVTLAEEHIPAGLDEDVRVAAVQVYQDLFHRAYVLQYTFGHIANGLYALDHPGEVTAVAQDVQELADQARLLLSYGGMSQARFAEDVALLEELAAGSDQPAEPVPPDSDAAGLLAFELAWLRLSISGCHADPGAPTDVASQQEAWQSVEVGPIDLASSAIQAHYDPVEGWQIRFPYC